MSIALFFITHSGIASNLLNIGESIIKQPGSNLSYHEVQMDDNIDTAISNIENKLSKLELDDGIIFISDIYGSTPSNIAQKIASKYQSHLICGVNLPMVIRLLNYREENQESLIEKALDGACKGIQHSVPQTSK